MRQLLDLEPLWRDFPHFFVTEDTALGRSVAAEHDTEFVPHFALGQARLGKSLTMLRAAWSSLWKAQRMIRRRRPDVVITTGAGSQLFVVLMARLLGARVILIDSFARFDGPSAFARLAGPLSHHRIAQSAEAARHWRGAEVFDPLREVRGTGCAKEELIFATVGATLPFARLVRFVVEAKKSGLIPEQVILQTGEETPPKLSVEGLTFVKELDFTEIKALLARARTVVCHGGTGSIITALQQGCATIVLPRDHALGEHYDDHQKEIARHFAARRLIYSVASFEEFAGALVHARRSAPRPMTTDYSDLMVRLRQLICRTDRLWQMR